MHNGRHGQRQQICWYILPIIFDQIQREILKSLKKLCDWIQSAKSEIELSTTDPGISGCKPEWEIKDCNLPNTLHTMCFVLPCIQNLVFSQVEWEKSKTQFLIRKVFHIVHFTLIVVIRTSCTSISCSHADKWQLWDNSYRNSLHAKEKRSDLVPNVGGKYKEYPIQLRYFPTT